MPRKLNPKLKLWRKVLDKHGIKGVLRSSDERFNAIKDEYDELVKKKFG